MQSIGSRKKSDLILVFPHLPGKINAAGEKAAIWALGNAPWLHYFAKMEW